MSKLTPSNILNWSFLAGILIYISVMSLVQDYVGLERWIVFVRDMWGTAYWTVPLAILILLIGMALYGHARTAAAQPWMVRDLNTHTDPNRFCRVCGADSARNEPCDSGLHS